MDTSICISNETLQAVTGTYTGRRINVKEYAAVPLPDGSVINGVITDEHRFGQALDELCLKFHKNAFSNVRIVMASNQIYVKRMLVPPLSSKQMLEYVANAFTEVGNNEELLFDYTLLGKEDPATGTPALLCAAQKSLIASYVSLFTARQISISCIDTMHTSQLKLIRLLPSTKTQSCIVLAFDGNNLSATLYIDGQFRFANRTRLFAERGTPEGFTEVERMVSSILQFNLSERSGATITNVYMTGLHENETPVIGRIETAFGLEAAVLSDPDGVIASGGAEFDLSAYSYAVGNLIRM